MLDRIQSSADRLISAIARFPEAYAALRDFTKGQVPKDEASRRLFGSVPETFDKDAALPMWRNLYRIAKEQGPDSLAYATLRGVSWTIGLKITAPDGTVFNEEERVVEAA